jgi:hypothetical protein
MAKTNPGTTISNSTFVGAQYSEQHASSIRAVADALAENARALGRLADCLAGKGVVVEALIKIGEVK